MKHIFIIMSLLTSTRLIADPITLQVLQDNADKNAVYSPLSLNEALAMVYAGSSGNTAAEIQKVTGWSTPANTAYYYSDFNGFLSRLDQSDIMQIKNANSLWLQESFTLEPSYLATVKLFGAESHTVDYINHTENARNSINAWVDQKTQSKIQNLIAPGALTPATKLVLCNAVYFKADWASQFEPESTQDQAFTTTKGTVQAKMMHKTASFQYSEDADMQYLYLPYKGLVTGMIICLPKTKAGLQPWLASLQPKELATIPTLFSEKYQRINVSLPKFKIETTQAELVSQMQKCGIKQLFSPAAELDGIANGQGLFVSGVIQKAMVAVDEKGTEAAAATAMMVAGCAMPIGQPIDFTVDHPFLFLIVTKAPDSKQSTVLFTGTVQNPTIK
jgi:serpin B